MSKEEIQRLAEMRREQQRAQSNIVQVRARSCGQLSDGEQFSLCCQATVMFCLSPCNAQGALEEAQLITWPAPKKVWCRLLELAMPCSRSAAGL